jgi:hypothetical protein
MMDITELFATRILTPRELLGTLYGILHLIHKMPNFEKGAEEKDTDLFIHLYLFRDSFYVSDVYPLFTFSTKQDFLTSCIEEVCDVCNPTYILHPSLYQKYSKPGHSNLSNLWGTNFAFIGEQKGTIYISSKEIEFCFPSARERLQISQYLISTLQKIHIKASEDTPNIKSLLESLEAKQKAAFTRE